ncbi:hypothetical protein Tco_0149620 [Tanacetum coccineum]
MTNQEQNPPQQEQPFVAAKQVSFNIEDIILNTNNEVTLLYPEHNNKDYFKCVSDFISKWCLGKPFTISPNMYKEYIAEFWYSVTALENSKVSFLIPTGGIYGEVGVNTFRNAIGAHYLPHSSEYGAPPSIDIVRQWFPTIGYGEECLGGKTGGFNQITNKDAIVLYSLANGIKIDYANIFWEDIIIKLKKKHREKVVPYTRFLSLLMMHKMKKGYGDGIKLGAKPRHKMHSTSSKQPSVSSKEATKGGSSKAPTSSKTGHSKKRKEFSYAMDSNPSHPLVSTPVDTGMHKEYQQATGGPTSLRVTSEARANPQLSSGMSAFNLNEPIYSTSFIIHSESALGNDASAFSIAEADPGKSAPSDFVPQQHGLETVLIQTTTGKGASSIARQVKEDEASRIIKLEDLAKLVSSVQPSFKDLDSPEDDPIIVVDDSDEDEEADEVHATINSQKHKLELEKNKAEAEATLLKAQPSFPNVEQLNELLVKSLQTEFSKILSAHDFSNSLPTELKDLPSKFNELTEEVKGLKKQVHELEIELLGDLKEIPSKLEDFTKTVISLTSQVAELKTLQ